MPLSLRFYERLFPLVILAILHDSIGCPSNVCECLIDSQNNLILNCRGKGLLTVPTFIFSGLDVYSADLSRNDISSIPQRAFINLSSSLREVRLDDNPLATIDELAFSGLTLLTSLSIRVLRVATWSSNLSLILQTITSTLPSLRTLTISSVALNLSDSSSPFVGTQNLSKLSLIDCGLSAVPAHLFAPLASSLTALDLSQNQLASFPSDALAPLRALSSLSLASNQLSGFSLAAGTAAGGAVAISPSLETLVELNLAQNVLQNISGFGSGAQRKGLPFPELRVLNVGYNRLLNEDLYALRGLLHLKHLYLQHNLISEVGAIFTSRNLGAEVLCCQQLLTLSLSYNFLTEIHAFSLSAMSRSLSSLRLDHNSIRLIDENAFAGFQNLSYLDLTGNPLLATGSFLSSSRGSFLEPLGAALSSLSLEDTGFSERHLTFLSSAARLETLSLSANNLTALPPFALSGFPRLESLSLTSNRLSFALPAAALVGARRLSRLQLAGNRLTGLEPCAARLLPRLAALGLAANPLTCDCTALWLCRWLASRPLVERQLEGWTCAAPATLAGRLLAELSVEQLCPNTGANEPNVSACDDLEARLLLTLPISWSARVSTAATCTHSITDFVFTNQFEYFYDYCSSV